MRNLWLILKREYLQRVRTRSFLVLTVLLPVIMTAFMALPAKMATVGEKPTHVVVVSSSPRVGEMVRQQLLVLATPAFLDEDEEGSRPTKKAEDRYIIDLDGNATEAEKATLTGKVSTRAIDGFLWATDDAIADRKVVWTSRGMLDFAERMRISEAVGRVAVQKDLAANGMNAAQTEEVLKPVRLEPVRIEGGKEAKGNGNARLVEITVMVMLIYMAVLFYGISVMRSVLEEKNSRIMEVLLSSASSTELMAGKLLGVGAVGLTQILVWAIMAGTVALPALAAQPNFADLQISPGVIVAFAVYFLLGYLLYSTMYAAIGAVTTTEQEGQQIQFIIVIPLVMSVFMLMPAIRTPDSPVVFWMSLIPFFSPIVMYARIVVQTPPLWQIALSVTLLVGTIWGLVVLCARIYRIGVLIYGKRATIPEILKWLKYAKA